MINAETNAVTTFNNIKEESYNIVPANNYYLILDEVNVSKILKSDSSITNLSNFTPHYSSASFYAAHLKDTDEIVFSAKDSSNEYGLWMTDGTAEGTKVIFTSESSNRYPIINIIASNNAQSIFFKQNNITYKYSRIYNSIKKTNLNNNLLGGYYYQNTVNDYYNEKTSYSTDEGIITKDSTGIYLIK